MGLGKHSMCPALQFVTVGGLQVLSASTVAAFLLKWASVHVQSTSKVHVLTQECIQEFLSVAISNSVLSSSCEGEHGAMLDLARHGPCVSASRWMLLGMVSEGGYRCARWLRTRASR